MKSAELMEDLSKADFRTIKTFIQNNITAERLLVDILQTNTGEKSTSSKKLLQQETTNSASKLF